MEKMKTLTTYYLSIMIPIANKVCALGSQSELYHIFDRRCLCEQSFHIWWKVMPSNYQHLDDDVFLEHPPNCYPPVERVRSSTSPFRQPSRSAWTTTLEKDIMKLTKPSA